MSLSADNRSERSVSMTLNRPGGVHNDGIAGGANLQQSLSERPTEPIPKDVSSTEEEEDRRSLHSGTGILEFTTIKAGRDVTPANYHFATDSQHPRSLSGITVRYCTYNVYRFVAL